MRTPSVDKPWLSHNKINKQENDFCLINDKVDKILHIAIYIGILMVYMVYMVYMGAVNLITLTIDSKLQVHR